MASSNDLSGGNDRAFVGTERRRTRLIELMRDELQFPDSAIERNAPMMLPELGRRPVGGSALALDQRAKVLGKMREEIDFAEDAIVRFAKVRVQIDTDY